MTAPFRRRGLFPTSASHRHAWPGWAEAPVGRSYLVYERRSTPRAAETLLRAGDVLAMRTPWSSRATMLNLTMVVLATFRTCFRESPHVIDHLRPTRRRNSGLGGGQRDQFGGPRGCWRGQAVGGLEEQLLQRAGQVAAPYQGCRRGQRMILEADPDHAADAGRARSPDRPVPRARGGGPAGHDP